MNQFLFKANNGKKSRYRWIATVLTTIVLWFFAVWSILFLSSVFKELIIPVVTPSCLTLSFKILEEFDTFLFIGILLPILLFCYKLIHESSFKELFTGKETFDSKKMTKAFLIWFALLLFVFFLSFYSENPSINVELNIKRFLFSTFFTIILIPLQCIAEEVVFRGYLLQGFYLIFKKPIIALFCSSFLFWLLHIPNAIVDNKINITPIFIYGFIGLFLGFIALIDEGLEGSIGLHIANNVAWRLFITQDSDFSSYSQIFKITNNHSAAINYIAIITFLVLNCLFFLLYYFKEIKAGRIKMLLEKLL